MGLTPCPRCARKTPDGLLCGGCVTVFQRAVANVEAFLPALAEAAAGQANVARAIVHRAGPDKLAAVIAAEHRAVPARLRSPEGRIALVQHGGPGSLDAADLLAEVRATVAGCAAKVTGARVRERDLIGRRQLRGDNTRPVGPVCAPHLHTVTDPGCDDGGCKQYHPGHVHRPPTPGCRTGCKTRLHCRHQSCRRIRAGHDTEPGLRALHWLLRHTDQLRRSVHAPEIVAVLVTAARVLEETVDRRDPDVYVGPCDSPDVDVVFEDGTITPATGRICGVDLFCRLGDETVTCQACGAEYSIAERRKWLLVAVREVWARPAVIATALAALDVDLTAARLDQWISRDKRRHTRCWPGADCGHIVQVALDSDELDGKGKPLGRPLYRVGDVLDRVDALRAERAARAAEVAS